MNAAEMDVAEVLLNTMPELEQPYETEDMWWVAGPALVALHLERLDNLTAAVQSLEMSIRDGRQGG